MTEMKSLESENLIGKKVVSAGGSYMGFIHEANPQVIQISKRMFRVGPALKKRSISTEFIDQIDQEGVRLKPTASDIDDEQRHSGDEFFDFDRNFFIL